MGTATDQPRRRVQRVPAEWPVLHLEAEIPSWDGMLVGGLVRHSRRLSLSDLKEIGSERRRVPVHCVWGWSRSDGVWDGVEVSRVLEVVEPMGTYVTVHASSDTYSGCLPIADAARGMFVWGRDGKYLTPEYGGPLRFLPPPEYWAYKGVKWANRLMVGDRFVPGFWESKVADAVGRIPAAVKLP